MTGNDFRKPYLSMLKPVCEGLGCGVQNLVISRSEPFPRYREGIALALSEVGMSMPTIGRVLNRDHSTIVYALKRIRRRGHTPESKIAYEIAAKVVADSPDAPEPTYGIDALTWQDHIAEFRELSREVNALRRRVAELEARS